jgi:hypothetical protein
LCRARLTAVKRYARSRTDSGLILDKTVRIDGINFKLELLPTSFVMWHGIARRAVNIAANGSPQLN